MSGCSRCGSKALFVVVCATGVRFTLLLGWAREFDIDIRDGGCGDGGVVFGVGSP